MADYCTVLIPLGDQMVESDIPALTEYLTVESVNDGSIYVQNETAVSNFGWIEKKVTWSDVTVPENLLKKAKKYLEDVQFDNMELEISAVDLHLLNKNIESFELLDQVQCVSYPHGMDRYFPVKKITIPLDEPNNTTYSLGDKIKVSLTASNNIANTELTKKIETLPTSTTILDEAKRNAASLIGDATSGYITIKQGSSGADEIIISDTPDYLDATKVWRWNLNGLGYSDEGYNPEKFKTAITIDGKIVADFITAGLMSADRIKGGTLQLGGYNNQNGVLQILDTNGNVIGTWDKNGIDAANGSFTGTITSNNASITGGYFTLDLPIKTIQ